MQRIWFIFIHEEKKGPYSLEDLIQHPDIEIDTYVWKKGMKEWTPLYKISELQPVIQAKKKKKPPVQEKKKRYDLDEVLVQTNQFHPPPFLWILFFIAIFFVYLILKVFF